MIYKVSVARLALSLVLFYIEITKENHVGSSSVKKARRTCYDMFMSKLMDFVHIFSLQKWPAEAATVSLPATVVSEASTTDFRLPKTAKVKEDLGRCHVSRYA